MIDLDFRKSKGLRLLNMYERLNKGECLNKSELITQYGVSAKTIQRDIDDLRNYIHEKSSGDSGAVIQYNKAGDCYELVRSDRQWLTKEEVMSLCKIVLESRAFIKEEIEQLISKLVNQVAPSERVKVENLIRNEMFHYVPLAHGKPLLEKIWSLSEHIDRQDVLEIEYQRADGKTRIHSVNPNAIMFSEFYFYLIAHLADGSKDYPTVFRLDRIERFSNTGDRYRVEYINRFNEGEFRKRVQFMYSGALQKIRFKFSGPSLEAVLDRLPTAQIIESGQDGTTIIQAEAYGNGIFMWLKSQGDNVEILL